MKHFFLFLAFLVIALTSTTLYATTPHYVGEVFGGGVVVWVDCSLNADHGLIAALTDQSPVGGTKWEDAKTLCLNYSGGGFADWRLPSKDELFRVACKAHHVAGGVVNGLHESSDSNNLLNYYWSSTEFSATHAYVHFMWNAANSGGNAGYNLKTILLSVRAVRSF